MKTDLWMIYVKRNHKFSLEKNAYLKNTKQREIRIGDNDNNIKDGLLNDAFCHDVTL